MTEQMVLEIKNLTKYYGKFLAVQNVNIAVKTGTVYGFLGPNGAGKTTTIRIILSILKPSSGEVKLFGIPVNRSNVQIHEKIGYIPGDVALYGHLTVKQMLDYFASLRPTQPSSRMEEMIELFDLDVTKNTKMLSRGNRQKVAIVQAFMHDPEFYIFDEPSSGLDPLMQQVLYDLIAEEVKKGKTFFISSHYLGEIQKIANIVSIIRDGEIISTMDVAKLDQQVVQKVHIDFKSDVDPSLLQDSDITVLSHEKNELILIIKGDFNSFLDKISKYPIEKFYAPEPSLEDYFMHFYDLKRNSGVN
ncbi:MAG: ABC transporter ATP-binding protein [Candidatus Heimdallarchaeota archaeon]|nr:ABC transporter ATP-binding protein [Candidatus Heimdallarchaeota archaeon]